MIGSGEYSGVIGPVARDLCGDPNPKLSGPSELRFGTHGSLSVDLDKDTWFDHEAEEGGGVLALVSRHTGREDGKQWLIEEGHLQPDAARSASPATEYNYADEHGEILFQVVRKEGHKFSQRRQDESGGWVYKVGGVRQVPYRLPELLANADGLVFVVEGEKDVDNLRAAGLLATCNAGGAGKWRDHHSEHLRDRDVVVLPDNDGEGRKHAEKVRDSLTGIARLVRVLELPGLAVKGDVSDWLAAGGTADALVGMLPNAEAAPADKRQASRKRKASKPIAVPSTDGLQWAGAHDPCTHLANAHRLVQAFGDHLLYVESIGWFTWAPPWRHDDLGSRRIAQGLGKMIANEAAALAPWVAAANDTRERDEREAVMRARFKWATASENAMNIESSLRMAQPLLSCKADVMDAAPMLLGLPSGVLELDTGKHREHRQSDRLTRTAGCDFEPTASCPTWLRFVGEVMGGDPELLAYLQQLAGYALSGHRGEHILPILWGGGANGKTTFLGTLQHMLGDYAGTAAPGLLIARGGNEHPTGLADLQGRRLVVVSETGEAGRLNEEQVKALTGGDRITARRMQMDFYQFDPSHMLILQTNHKPRVTGTDEGIWRRLRLIPFTVTVPADKRDPKLPDKLRAEARGILAWAFEGWRKYQRDGFLTPAAVTAATNEYRDASDQIGAFVSESCEVGIHFTVASADLYRAYSTWCEEAGERPRSQRELGMRLAERGFDRSKGTAGARRWHGLTVSDVVALGAQVAVVWG